MKKEHLSTQEDKDGQFVKYVLHEYEGCKRDNLPWRKTLNAYAILVSEIMLQQTQVSRVIPKWKAWMKQYPTLSSLRTAKLSDVLLLWQGLGYQRRAKALFEIARMVRSVPKRFDELILLPGVGTYTASAVCAFAYDSFAHPLLETNIRTALIEHFHARKKKVDDRTLYNDLLRLECNSRAKSIGARVWYSALMDYGAHLKASDISHNARSPSYAKQTRYKGSFRELRAKILFSIAHKSPMPKDKRGKEALQALEKEGYIKKKGRAYAIARG